MASISLDTPPQEMLKVIALSREKVGREKESTELINLALEVANDLMINLYLEKCTVFQHLIMTERDKPRHGKIKRDDKLIKQAVKNWRRTLMEAETYAEVFRLKRWRSRIYRFWGRLLDAQGKHARSIPYYEKSIRLARLDPEFVEQRIPRWLEVEAFLASALMLSGHTKAGLAKSRRIYKKFDVSEGKRLREKDYSTWAIWKSGVPIRIGQALQIKKLKINLAEYKTWLNDAEKLLYPPPEVKVWVDFGFRKNEIVAIRRELKI